MKKDNETALVKSLLDYLHNACPNVVVWRQNQGMIPNGRGGFKKFTGRLGVSDIIGFVRPSGRFLAVEAKVGTNKCSDHQAAFLTDVEKAGGIAVVAYSIADLEARLKEEGVV
jgi:hypothetical protein